MQENQSTEATSQVKNLEAKQEKLEEKATLLIDKISEVANENLKLKDDLHKKRQVALDQEEKIRLLSRERDKLKIKLQSSSSSVEEKSDTIRTLSHEIHTVKTLVRYLLSHEITKLYYSSRDILNFPKKILLTDIRKFTWNETSHLFWEAVKAFKNILLTPIKLRQLYYYRKIKKQSPSSKAFLEMLSPEKINLQMKQDLRKSLMLDQLVERSQFLQNEFPPYIPERLESIHKLPIKVACILDEFSYSCFQYECEMTQLNLKNWEEQLEKGNFELLFVESAWKGKDLAWKEKIENLKSNEENPLSKLVRAFQKKGIPTVFWNKEDPSYYKHFLEAAKLFDHVFTTDENRVEDYKKELGHSNVQSLSFACQPILHNPIGSYDQEKRNVAFAGSWHENIHEDRKKDFHNLLRPALPYDLHIFDRMADHILDHYIFPLEYQRATQGNLPYNRVLTAYKRYKAFLNVNSVQNSPTMFSRRVFELMASGTNVISGKAKGLLSTFKDDFVIESSKEEETKEALENLLKDKDKREKQAHKAMREVLSQHTYTHRLQEILQKVGFKNKNPLEAKQKIAVFIELQSAQHLKHSIHNFQTQVHPEKELHFICQTKKQFNKFKKKLPENESIHLHHKDEGESFYDSFFRIISRLDCQFLSFFKESDFYGPHLLSDFLLSFLYTDTSLVTKQSSYCFNSETGELHHGSESREHRSTSSLNESCFLAQKNFFLEPLVREMLSHHKTTLNEVTQKLQYDLHASDRFNYLKIYDSVGVCVEKDYRLIKSACSNRQAEDFTTA